MGGMPGPTSGISAIGVLRVSGLNGGIICFASVVLRIESCTSANVLHLLSVTSLLVVRASL
jgi:hypothetical protein